MISRIYKLSPAVVRKAAFDAVTAVKSLDKTHAREFHIHRDGLGDLKAATEGFLY